MEKRFTTLEKNISKFIKPFGVKRAFNHSEFAYYYQGSFISFTCSRYSEDKEFIDFIEKTYGVEDLKPWFFVFCILHEVGHHMTLDYLTEEEMALELMLRTQCETNLDNETYFTLPAEDLANRWAIEYLINHTEKCWKFQRKCFSIIRHLQKKSRYPL